jgi:hypothetical protein
VPATKGDRDDVVEVEQFAAATLNALAFVASPDKPFDIIGNTGPTGGAVAIDRLQVMSSL